MKVIELHSFTKQGLRETERPRPVPGPRQLLVRIDAVSLNPRDLEIIEGRYGMPVELPIVPVSDAVGQVVEIGREVRAFAVGDRVNPLFFPDWQDGQFHAEYFATQLGAGREGLLQEFVALDESAAVKAPAHLGDEAATLPIAALTAWRALHDAHVGAGQTVLLLGLGGVSMFALQFATMFGARAIVVAADERRADSALSHGALHAIDRQREPSWSDRVLELTDGRGADIVVEVVGASTFLQSAAALATGGRIAVVGYLSGSSLQIDIKSLFIAKRAQLLGQTVGSRRDFDAMNRALELHGLVPVVDSRHAFGDLRAALARVASGEALGKVIVHIGEVPYP